MGDTYIQTKSFLLSYRDIWVPIQFLVIPTQPFFNGHYFLNFKGDHDQPCNFEDSDKNMLIQQERYKTFKHVIRKEMTLQAQAYCLK